MRSLSRMKNDRDLVNTLSSSSLSYTFTWVISRMCIEVPNLVIYNSNLRHRYMAIRLLWLLSNKGLLRLHILFFFVIEKCEASAIFGSFELYLRTKQLILSPEYFFLLFLLMLAICGIPVVYLGPQISVNFPICIPSGGHCWLLLYRVQPFKSRYIWKEILNGTIVHERFYFLIVGHSVFQTHFHGHMMCKHITTLSLRQIPIQDVMDCSNHGWILKITMQSNHWAY